MSFGAPKLQAAATMTTEPIKEEIPQTPEELRALIESRPDCWEFFLFAGEILHGKNELAQLWRDHELRLPSAEYRRVDDDDVAAYVSEAFSRLVWCVSPIEPLFAGQEEAFGRPGESGNPELIQHLAGWLIEVYRRLLEWTATVRSVSVSEEFEFAMDLCSQAGDQPLEQVRSFIDETVSTVAELPAKLAVPEEERDPIELEFILTLKLDIGVAEAAVDELRRARGQEPEN